MDELLRYELKDGIASVTLDDGKANVMSLRMLHALDAALDRAQAEATVLLLSGRPGMFSGGFDLAVFKHGPDEIRQMLEAGARLAQRLLALPCPLLVACSGHAVAMGAFIVLCGDVRIGVDAGARIQINEVQIGLTLPRFAIELCRQRLAPAHFNLAALTAEPYAGEQAVAAGFLDAVVPASELAQAAHARALQLAQLPPQAFAATKLRLREAALAALQQAVQEDRADWAQRFGTSA